jgi:hypothetical protein
MPEFQRSAVIASAVTSTGAGTTYFSAVGASDPTFHVQGTSFHIDIHGTNFVVDGVGSFWTTVGSAITTSGLYSFGSALKIMGFRTQVNSVSSGSNVSVALFQ